MVNRRNPAAGDPYWLSDAVGRSVIITGATGALGSAAPRPPDRLHHGGPPVTAAEGVEAAGLAGRRSHRPGASPDGQQGVAIARAPVSRPAAVFADEPAGHLASRASAEVPGLLRRCVTGFGQTPVMVTHDPAAAAYWRRDPRWPAGRRRVPGRGGRVFARLPGVPARPCRLGLHHPNFAKITPPSPGSTRHRRARAC
jgi:hypothetical protein